MEYMVDLSICFDCRMAVELGEEALSMPEAWDAVAFAESMLWYSIVGPRMVSFCGDDRCEAAEYRDGEVCDLCEAASLEPAFGRGACDLCGTCEAGDRSDYVAWSNVS